ncbi:MAG: ester cyclase [Candidatus Binatia bacterium]
MSTQENLKLWETHIRGEFMEKDTDLSLSTMVEDASVLTVPTGWGGKGKAELRPRYRDEFIPSIPPSWKHTTLKVTATDEYIVEEAKINLVHTQQMDWFLPGIPPTNQPIEFDIVLVVQFRDGKMAAERIYWDQATVLRQIGRL